MKSIADSVFYQDLKAKTDIDKNIESINDSMIIDKKLIETHLLFIEKKFNKMPLTTKILQYYKEGKINIIYQKKPVLFSYLPVVGRVISGGDPAIYVDITPFSKDKKNELKIDLSTLYCLLEYSVFLYDYFIMKKYVKIEMHPKIVRNIVLLYSKMCHKIMSALYGVDVEDRKSDIIRFLFSKFCLINIMGKKNDNTTNEIAYNSIFFNTTKRTIFNVDNTFEPNAYHSMKDFFTNLKTITGFEETKIIEFVPRYLRTYGESSAMSFDWLPGIFYVVFCTYNNVLIEHYILNNLAEREISEIYIETLSLIK